MKVRNAECLAVHPGWRKNLIFIRLELEDGTVGWGESYSQYDRDEAVAAQARELLRYLVGRDVFNIRYFCQVAFDDYAQRRSSLEFWSALSGIEMAMWDAVGKLLGQPVHRLLGGRCRERVRVYANGWGYKLKTPDDYARAAEQVVAAGFDALKFDPLPRPWRTYIPREHILHAVAVVRAVRDAVGPSVELLLDLHRRLAPVHAIELARQLEPLNPYWIEEPCQKENMEAIQEVRQATTIPVVTGEALYGRADFRSVFRSRAADIINPDVSNCGGILELLFIAAQAETEMIAVSPHNYNSTLLSLSATVHAAACMPNFTITEYFVPFEEFSQRISRQALKPVDGYIQVPELPGLGLDIDEAALRSMPSQPYPTRSLRHSEDDLEATF
ncbi:mandelate racemase/muconate lactonizing enzyme family protein [Pigmentiphaga sp. GD03639]|uniref:mandelate racemase/muconate lactonizing enzyme family protein n=1 Tax=Pigmentiphaga sp. GD03639 TaxID=2975354 RepID=UPI00244D2E04|nr:mandelate racemase/muconate lactonizing enzyme family protein [Pigmentiphaga sp. GD03639]MDH2239601.1 mandelate racemase/muconate lactonizing enzyme family protein [Pigmentiphaga sp. GD03639]